MTYAHKGGRNLADVPLAAGIPSYVMQEEFSRYQGYWWQPVVHGNFSFCKCLLLTLLIRVCVTKVYFNALYYLYYLN